MTNPEDSKHQQLVDIVAEHINKDWLIWKNMVYDKGEIDIIAYKKGKVKIYEIKSHDHYDKAKEQLLRAKNYVKHAFQADRIWMVYVSNEEVKRVR